MADHKTGDVPNREEEFGSVLDEIASSSAGKIVISAEGFFALKTEAIRYLLQAFSGFDVRIVFYIRRQDETFLSTYTQQAKNPRTAFVKPIYAFLDAPDSLSLDLDIYQCASKWAAVFGKDRLVPRLYAEAGDITRDFMSYVGEGQLDEILLTAKRQHLNTSQSLEALEYVRAFKQQEPDTQFYAAAQHALFRHFATTGRPAFRLLSTADKRHVLNHYRASNERLFAEYFGRENLFDPDRLLSGDTSERIHVDTSDVVHLVRELLTPKPAATPVVPPNPSLAGRLKNTFSKLIKRD